MSQTKAQLVNPLDGDVGNKIVVGSAVTINSTGVDAGAGIITATSFTGDGGNLTGLNIPAGYIELDGALFN